jgi:hypothetical protein
MMLPPVAPGTPEPAVADDSHGPAPTLRIIGDVAAWDAIRADWDALHQASPTASTPLDFAGLRLWWDVYGPV